jgi:hypothetical protein
MTNFVNLTPHPVRLRADVANTEALPAEGDIVIAPRKGPDGKADPARVSAAPGGAIGHADGVALFGRTAFGAVEGLPAPTADTILIVSALVAGRVNGRDDVFAPGTGPKDGAVRFGDGPQAGQIFAVTRLVQAG